MTIRALLTTVNEATGDTVAPEDIDLRAAMLAAMVPDVPQVAFGARAQIAAWHTFTAFPSLATLAGWLRGVAVLTAPQASSEPTPEPPAETKSPDPVQPVGRLVPRQAGA